MRRSGSLAGALCTAAVALSIAGIVFVVLSRDAPVPAVIAFRGFDAIIAVVFAGVGGVVAARRPSNPIGWIFLAEGIVEGFAALGHAYGVYALISRGGAMSGGAVMAWAQELLGTGVGYAVIVGFLLFPDGRLVSRRWRPIIGLAVIASLLESTGTGFAPGAIRTLRSVQNPFAVRGSLGRVFELGLQVGGVLFVITLVASVVSLILRYRRSQATARQQLKRIAVATFLVGVGALAFTFTGGEAGSSAPARASQIFLVLALCGIPITTGLAILRYRLYDIDRIISRTLAYAIITAILGGVLALVVLVPTAAIGATTPGWLVAVATLAAFGLFRPVRRRVQNAVDHRFNRRRYDTEQTIEAFTARLREQFDIDALGAELRGVVAQTMQPAHVSLWIREQSRT